MSEDIGPVAALYSIFGFVFSLSIMVVGSLAWLAALSNSCCHASNPVSEQVSIFTYANWLLTTSLSWQVTFGSFRRRYWLRFIICSTLILIWADGKYIIYAYIHR